MSSHEYTLCIERSRCSVIYAILSYYTYILDITMTVGIIRISYKFHEIS